MELLDGKQTTKCSDPALAKALRGEDMHIQSPLSGLGHSTTSLFDRWTIYDSNALL